MDHDLVRFFYLVSCQGEGRRSRTQSQKKYTFFFMRLINNCLCLCLCLCTCFCRSQIPFCPRLSQRYAPPLAPQNLQLNDNMCAKQPQQPQHRATTAAAAQRRQRNEGGSETKAAAHLMTRFPYTPTQSPTDVVTVLSSSATHAPAARLDASQVNRFPLGRIC